MIKNEKHNIKRTINKLIRSKGRFPTLQEMCNLLGYSADQVRNYMTALEQDGYLEKIGTWYRFPAKKIEEISEDEPIEIEPIEKIKFKLNLNEPKDIPLKIEKVPKRKYKSRKKKEDDNIPVLAIYVIKWCMLAVGTGSIIISVYYNTRLALEFLPFFLAIIAGVIFVLFSVVSFEAILLFLSYKKVDIWKRIAIVFGLSCLWLIVAAYSVTATVSGRYDRHMANEQHNTADNRGISVGRLKWQNIQDRKNHLMQMIESKRDKIERLNKISSGVDSLEGRDENNKIFIDTERRINNAERAISKYIYQLEKIRKEETRHLELSPESTSADNMAGKYQDFYAWLSEIFGITKERMHFFISLAPAFFFDFVSPISIAFFLFLRKI